MLKFFCRKAVNNEPMLLALLVCFADFLSYVYIVVLLNRCVTERFPTEEC